MNELGLRDVKVFRVNETDAVAAYTLVDAVSWYKKNVTSDVYEYEDIEELPLDTQVWKSEDSEERQTVREILDSLWDGEPFIAVCTKG